MKTRAIDLSEPQECLVRAVNEAGETVYEGAIMARLHWNGESFEMDVVEGVEWEVTEDAVVQLEVEFPTGDTLRIGGWYAVTTGGSCGVYAPTPFSRALRNKRRRALAERILADLTDEEREALGWYVDLSPIDALLPEDEP